AFSRFTWLRITKNNTMTFFKSRIPQGILLFFFTARFGGKNPSFSSPARSAGWFVRSQGLGNPAGLHAVHGQVILKPSGRMACQRHRPIDSRIPILLLS
ncbi:MAG TPA: hypothetical protein PLX29_10255, partial [Anaerolineaceae bacterium]|nr:hypothetical protein [Anaerolineaceae bacterium]